MGKEIEEKTLEKVNALPKRSVKKTKDPGRDEALSEYLASLGGIDLLTGDEEKELAKTLLEAEVECWTALLSVADAVSYLAAHPIAEDKKFSAGAALQRHAKRFKKPSAGALKLTPRINKDIADIAASLREADEDRLIVEELLEVLDRAPSKQAKAMLREASRARRQALRIRNHFVRANLRLVVSVARRFHHNRMPLIDLIQEGNLGLIKSVHRFDHTRGFRFSTYAHWWIRQAIERAIMNKGAQVRLPVHIFDARREIAKATQELAHYLERAPTVEELAEALATPVEKLEDILKATPRDPISLDEPVGDDEDRTLSETICDADDDTPDEKVISVDQAKHVRRILHRLTPMEVDIIERRFGLVGDQDETLEEIGRSYNLSRERVRQIQVQGLRKMQRYAERRSLAV